MEQTKYCLCCNENVTFNTIKRNENIELTCAYCGFTLEVQQVGENKTSTEPEVQKITEQSITEDETGGQEIEELLAASIEPEEQPRIFKEGSEVLQIAKEALKEKKAVPEKPQKKDDIKKQEHTTKITLEGETYLIDSDDLGIQNPNIITRIYKKGMIIYSHKINYKDILNEPDFDKRFTDLLKRQQQIAIEALKEEKAVPEKPQKKDDIKEREQTVTQKRTYKEYVNELEALISKNIQEEALELLTEALEHYPNNPVILSYCGYIEALVNKQYADGIKICRQSFKILKEQMSLGEGFFLPVLYLNLGRAYLTANKKKEAYYSFQKGLDVDKKNENLLKELKKIGIRRKPFFPFLKRANPLNKYIGMLTYDLQKKKVRP